MQRSRQAFYVLVAAFVLWAVLAVRAGAGDPSPTTTGTDPEPPPEPAERTLQGLTIDGWHRAAARYLGRVRSLQAAVRHDPETSAAIRLACITYPTVCGWLWRVARCESNLHRYSVNALSGASGLYQFLGSTWRGTAAGRAGISVFDPYASALMAGRYAANGGTSAWVCR
jgi:Transglycosylase-like domain